MLKIIEKLDHLIVIYYIVGIYIFMVINRIYYIYIVGLEIVVLQNILFYFI